MICDNAKVYGDIQKGCGAEFDYSPRILKTKANKLSRIWKPRILKPKLIIYKTLD